MTQASLFSLLGLFLSGAGGMLLNVAPLAFLKLLGLLLLYLGGSVLLLNICSFQMCAALFVCGIGSVVLLWSVQRSNFTDVSLRRIKKEWFAFRLLLNIMLGVLAYSAMELLRYWVPVRSLNLFVSLWVGLMSIINLNLDDIMLFRCICLQSACLAFTILYIYIENSVLVFAFLAVINLLMAFGGSVLSMEENPDLKMEMMK